MSAASLRAFYGVPAKRGMWIKFDGQPARITGFDRTAMRLIVRIGDESRPQHIHPTWRVEYPV